MKKNRWSILVRFQKKIKKLEAFATLTTRLLFFLSTSFSKLPCPPTKTKTKLWRTAPTRAARPSSSALCSSRPRSSRGPWPSRPTRPCRSSRARDASLRRAPLPRARHSPRTTPRGRRRCSPRTPQAPVLLPWRRTPPTPRRPLQRLPLLLVSLMKRDRDRDLADPRKKQKGASRNLVPSSCCSLSSRKSVLNDVYAAQYTKCGVFGDRA